jgi:transposase
LFVCYTPTPEAGDYQATLHPEKWFFNHRKGVFVKRKVRGKLWYGPECRIKTLLRFYREFGKERNTKLKYACSDTWEPHLKVIAKRAPNALNILDRFHIMRKFNEAIAEVRRIKASEFEAAKQENILEKKRWLLLKRLLRIITLFVRQTTYRFI